MNILLTGASGFIGRSLYQALSEDGHTVTAAVRNPERFQQRFPHAKTVRSSFTGESTSAQWAAALAGKDVVINAAGIIRETRHESFRHIHTLAPCAMFDACESAGVRKVIQISALGADETGTTAYHRSKYEADQHLKTKQLDWVIIRPSIVCGSGAASSELFSALSALPLTPLVNDGDQLIQPVSIDDLIECVRHSIQPTVSRCYINAVGPEPMRFRDFLEVQRRWLGKETTCNSISLPQRACLKVARILQPLNLGPITPETVTMLAQGNTASAHRFSTILGRAPAPVTTVFPAFGASVAQRWYAHLYFMPLILIWSLAFVWIFTGLTSLLFYPESKSLEILRDSGLTGNLASLCLYAGGVLDLALGVAMCWKRWLKTALTAQLSLMLGYTLILTVTQPELWLHPFGPVTKNFPMIAATLCLFAISRK